MKPKLPKHVSTISRFVDWVEGVGDRFTDATGYETPWFRGVGDAGFKLLPGLYRTAPGLERFADDELRTEFSRKALPLVAERAPRDEWEWYFLMQHYRAPTRLLDWTDAALVALYFALNSRPSPDARAAVWALNPFSLNRYHRFYGAVGTDWEGLGAYLPERYSGKRLPRYPIAIDPTFTMQRMLVQHSHFTLHGKDTRPLDAMRTDLSLERDLVSVTIDADQDDVEYLRWHLTLLGITETTIFPDLEGLARELRLEYDLDKVRPKVK
jgi:hypothetical protein